MKYVKQIEDDYNGYLHYLFRQAVKVKGPKAGANEITFIMNQKISIPSNSWPNLNLHRLQINRWLIINGGIEILAKEKPLDTMVCCEAR